MLGVSRQCSAVSALEASVSVGMRSALAVSGSRSLSRSGNSKGSLNFSWGPRDGSALSVGLERKLADTVRGHWTWTLGPAGGIVTGAHGRHGKWAWSGDVRVGVANGASAVLRSTYAPGALALRARALVVPPMRTGTPLGARARAPLLCSLGPPPLLNSSAAATGAGLQGSVVRQLSPKHQVRATAKAGSTGIFLDVGGVRKLSPDCSVGMSVTMGLQARSSALALRRTRAARRSLTAARADRIASHPRRGSS